ncbi:AraC family transcriptional regulator [Bacillus sp. ISL-40]|uniref:AraC family transcriptional regulator n=1 Tax=unclassified Bacillus (in: firmicutes) TaxID=185979 RepID=UPI001BEA8947|nr:MULTISPECIES: AraC family transcriptional regulator [unclassified Bacillus (in: firmicutes)]MBT2696431.1 AraC family transcriptional regulator [Bacillus sp. ISL-40]MBT2723205.1 AraC family transcriptional regulator [Bacillus sp. ISL-46]MBT2741553.1 AraC family transcriptional regulator [Bacillus sp. ISL-77]
MFEQLYKQRVELTKIIEHYTGRDGTYNTDIPSLFFSRYSNDTGPHYGVYKPSLCIIVQGMKEVLLSQESYQYGPADYLVASVNLPIIAQVTEASPEVPYLALKLEITPNEILEVLREFQMGVDKKENAKRGMYVSKIEPSLLDAVTRLARLLDTPKDIKVLAPLIVKEIIYRVLQGEHGGMLKQIAIEGSSAHQISDVIEHIMNNYEKSFKIDELAEIANMSVSSLHRHFKEITAMSPIQFQKQLRLQEARSLLLSESADAADVAFRVGYESPSQFSREYSRMFGLPPKEDINRLKATYV